jgi:hypothetical protein
LGITSSKITTRLFRVPATQAILSRFVKGKISMPPVGALTKPSGT